MNKNRCFYNVPGSQKTMMVALLGVAIILVILVAVDIFRKPAVETPATSGDVTGETPLEVEDVTSITPEEKDQFRTDVPSDIVVPDMNTQLTEEQKKEIAVPTVVVAAAPGTSSKFRNFAIRAEGSAFVPTKVIANVGDTVHIDFTAVDGAYDIVFPSYNMSQTAQKGETKILEFQALQEGSFTYYCSSCGGPVSGPKGNIIIVK